MKEGFSTLKLDNWLINSLANLGITHPTDVQKATIPSILNNQDVIASAKTGSGKTAAFALPILQQLSQDPYGIFALILTPTRELAFQIAEQFRVIGSGITLKTCIVVGGLDMRAQAIELTKRPHIVIATPGRLADHIRSSADAVFLKNLKFLVLDEADRLLDKSFKPDLSTIFHHNLPKSRSTLLFSATMTPTIQELTFSTDRKPFIYQGNTTFETVSLLDQKYLLIPSNVKDVYLPYMLRHIWGFDTGEKSLVEKQDSYSIKDDKKKPKKQNDDDDDEEKKEKVSVIIFCGKWKTCERIYLMLRELRVKCTALHSRLGQKDRLGSIAKFKSGIVPVLVTTDVGSRGLDIPTVQIVINFDLPADPTDYIHRIGRTARAGRGGLALSLISERDVEILLNIESKTNKKLVEFEGVSENSVLEMLNEVTLARRVANMTIIDETKSKYGRSLRKSINK